MDGNPCNMHLNQFADRVKFHVNQSGLRFEFLRLASVMVFRWVPRACAIHLYPGSNHDSIETNAGAEWYDALIALVDVIKTCREQPLAYCVSVPL